jgi:hypothetical protein
VLGMVYVWVSGVGACGCAYCTDGCGWMNGRTMHGGGGGGVGVGSECECQLHCMCHGPAAHDRFMMGGGMWVLCVYVLREWRVCARGGGCCLPVSQAHAVAPAAVSGALQRDGVAARRHSTRLVVGHAAYHHPNGYTLPPGCTTAQRAAIEANPKGLLGRFGIPMLPGKEPRNPS